MVGAFGEAPNLAAKTSKEASQPQPIHLDNAAFTLQHTSRLLLGLLSPVASFSDSTDRLLLPLPIAQWPQRG